MNICIFGDSITWGAYDPVGGGWANRLRFEIEKNHDNTDVMVLGVPGETTVDLLKRIGDEASRRRAEAVMIAIGINDSMYSDIKKQENKINIIDFEKNIYKLIKIAKEQTSKVVMIGLTDVDEKRTWPGWWNKNQGFKNDTINEYNIALGLICQKEKLPLISLQGVLDRSDYSDGLHPNSEGHRKIFEKIYRELKLFKGL